MLHVTMDSLTNILELLSLLASVSIASEAKTSHGAT